MQKNYYSIKCVIYANHSQIGLYFAYLAISYHIQLISHKNYYLYHESLAAFDLVSFFPPLGPLPKGGHGGKNYNTRTQVTFAVLCMRNLFLVSVSTHIFLFLRLEPKSAAINISERPCVSLSSASWQCIAKVSWRLFIQFKAVLHFKNKQTNALHLNVAGWEIQKDDFMADSLVKLECP